MKIKKLDIFIVLLIGEVAGWLLFLVIKNLESSISLIESIPLWILPVFFPIFCLIWFLLMFLLSKKNKSFLQIGKFALVGGVNFLLDLGVLNLLIFLTSIASGPFYSVFKGISFIVAVTNSYLLNKFWTFSDQKQNKKVGKEFLSFIVVSLIGLFINNIIASFLVNFVGPQAGLSENLWASIGAIVASFVGMFWNFVGYKFIVFKK